MDFRPSQHGTPRKDEAVRQALLMRQGVTRIKADPNQTSWPPFEDCTQITY